MSMGMFVKGVGFAVGGSFVERKLLPDYLPALFESSNVVGLPRAYGLCLGSVAVYGFWLTLHSMAVGSARKTFMEKARKDGEDNVDVRYSLPNLYVDGNTPNAKAFNCVQRSHQQQLETSTAVTCFVLIGGLCFPVTAGAAGLLYTLSRRFWAAGYSNSEGDPSKRYSHPLGSLFWKMLIAAFSLSMMASAETLGLLRCW